MFRDIVVGIDAHGDGHHEQIALAKNLLRRGGRLTLAHVLTSGNCAGRGTGSALSERESVARHLETIRAQTQLTGRVRCVRSSSVGHGLRQLAKELRADLLVIGQAGQDTPEPSAGGNDTLSSLNGAPCAVAVVRPGGRVWVRDVGVGYDGSLESEHALEVAKGIAGEHAASVAACEAVSDRAREFGPHAEPSDEWDESRLDDAHARIESLGIAGRVAYGVPSDELTDFSATIDLLVIGSRGFGPTGRLVHGNTSRRLAQRARCSLLILPRHSVGVERLTAPVAHATSLAWAGWPGTSAPESVSPPPEPEPEPDADFDAEFEPLDAVDLNAELEEWINLDPAPVDEDEPALDGEPVFEPEPPMRTAVPDWLALEPLPHVEPVPVRREPYVSDQLVVVGLVAGACLFAAAGLGRRLTRR